VILAASRQELGSRIETAALCTLLLASCALPQTAPSDKKTLWKPVEFAIVRFNDEAPKSWNIYHQEKRGILLLRLWKRYLLVNVPEQEVYDIDPETVKPHANNVEFSMNDVPSDALDVAEWKERNVGSMVRYRFRLSKEGHFLDIQIPLKPDGKPMY
jgi:hypothetical protein